MKVEKRRSRDWLKYVNPLGLPLPRLPPSWPLPLAPCLPLVLAKTQPKSTHTTTASSKFEVSSKRRCCAVNVNVDVDVDARHAHPHTERPPNGAVALSQCRSVRSLSLSLSLSPSLALSCSPSLPLSAAQSTAAATACKQDLSVYYVAAGFKPTSFPSRTPTRSLDSSIARTAPQTRATDTIHDPHTDADTDTSHRHGHDPHTLCYDNEQLFWARCQSVICHIWPHLISEQQQKSVDVDVDVDVAAAAISHPTVGQRPRNNKCKSEVNSASLSHSLVLPRSLSLYRALVSSPSSCPSLSLSRSARLARGAFKSHCKLLAKLILVSAFNTVLVRFRVGRVSSCYQQNSKNIKILNKFQLQLN